MTSAATLATRYAGRPVLMRPESALEIALQLRGMDARVLQRPSRIGALLRALRIDRNQAQAGPASRLAMEDDYGEPPPPFEERAAYSPLYAGEIEDLGYCWSLKSNVALMECDTPLLERGDDFCGVHHGYDTLLAGLQDASADERVRGVFLRLASPGGVVAGGLETLAAWMRANREAAGGKPIWIYADMACSAAYWIASQGDRILAPKVGMVGSIGAVIVHEDYSGALEKAGIAIEAIQFGASKTDGAWWASLSDEARADLQADIDQCGRNFVADVVAGRPQLTAEQLIATQAKVYMGAHDDAARSGLELGFVDEISGEADAFAALVEHVSTPGKTISLPTAVGGRAASGKEKPMALRPQGSTGRTLAQIRADRARAAAALAQLDAEAAEAEAAAEEGDDTVEGGGADDTVDGGDGDDTVAGSGADDTVAANQDDEAEAQAIAASAEGQANPAAALAAIKGGLTLKQFKDQVAAQAGHGRGHLAVVLADAPRLGPDGGKPSAAGGAVQIKSAGAAFADNLAKGLAARNGGRR